MTVVDLRVEDLKIHPKNVRKKYDNIDELTDSIRERGVLQNLTVVPEWNYWVKQYQKTPTEEIRNKINDCREHETYFVVIGNRRLTAAQRAGIETVPCIISEDMSDRDQVTMMLTENMNRDDLKVYEEAGAMQMCLEDFGISVDEIVKDTGLSKTTVNHRLNVAKLNQKELQNKVNSDEFQMTLTDLYSLEKIDDIKTRDEVLKEANNSRELSQLAMRAAREEMEKKHEQEFIELAEKRDIAEAPEEAFREFYSGKWDTIADWRLQDKVPKQLKLDKEKVADRELFYIIRYSSFYIIAKHKKEKKELTEYEIRDRERKKTDREIKAKYKVIYEDMGNFVRSIIDGSTKPLKDTTEIDETMWHILLDSGVCLSTSKIAEVLLGKDIWHKSVKAEERERVCSQAKELPGLHQRIASCYIQMKDCPLHDYRNVYRQGGADILKRFFGVLQQYGYSWPDEESIRFIDGEHEIFVKPEE